MSTATTTMAAGAAPKKMAAPGAAKKFASVGQTGAIPMTGGVASPKKVGVVGGGSVGAKGPGVAKMGGGVKKVGIAPPQGVQGVKQTGGVANNASPMRTRGLPEAPSMADGSGTQAVVLNGNNGNGEPEPVQIETGPITITTTDEAEQTTVATSADATPNAYVQKSFRATVNVDIAALRKGPSTLTLGNMNNSSGLINSSSSAGSGEEGSGHSHQNSMGGGDGGMASSGSAGSSSGAASSLAASNEPLPSNATKRIEESFANPIFSKVEVAIKGKRDNAAYEILTTEQSYCKSLTVLNELYRLPLLEACKRNMFPSLTEDLVTDIFSRFFVDISRVNFVLLQGLVERFGEWGDHQLLGDLLLDLLPFLKMYTMYTGNYERSMAALSELEGMAKEGSPLAAYLSELHHNPMRTVDLRSYLIMPIQRIPRYRLLLEELIKNTNQQHADYESLQKALESIKLVAAQIDAAIHEQKNRAKMLEIQDSFFGEKVQIIEAGRMFIKEGEMTKVCRKDTQKRFVWLFTDLFLYAKQLPSSSRYSKHRAFPLKNIRVKDIPDDGKIYKNAIQIASEKKSFVLLAHSSDEKASWMAEFAKAITEQESKIRTDANAPSNAVAPVWVPDSEALRCMICGDKFTLMQRRHHCRQCGNVVCSKCSAKKKELPGQGKKRVCDSCYTKPYPDVNSASPAPLDGSSNGLGGSQPVGVGAGNGSRPLTPSALSTSPSVTSPAALPGSNNGTVSVGPITISPNTNTTSPAPGLSVSPSVSATGPSPTSPAPQQQPRTSQTFRAAYDYEPPVENPKKKLAFKAGDVMEITIKNDPGWWFAIMGEARGWVPASFLEPVA